jgi:hypothetical protein
MPPTDNAQNSAPTAIVSAGASPVTLTIPPHAEPVVLTITSASAITVSAQTSSRPHPIHHTP